MADPISVYLEADTWVKVGSGVKVITIRPKACFSETTRFAVTHCSLGSQDPDEDAPRMPIREEKICIRSEVPQNVYVRACGAPGHVQVFDTEMSFL